MEVEDGEGDEEPEEVDSVDGLGEFDGLCAGEGGFRCGETVSYCDE